MLRKWKKARRSSGAEALGYPRINVLAKVFVARGREHIPDEALSDADIVQRYVNQMQPEIRSVFEAYHICLIRGQRCNGMPHEARATILGMPRSTYYNRRDIGNRLLSDWLSEYLDSLDSTGLESVSI